MTGSDTMEAWAVHEPGPIASKPLRRVRRAVPGPGPGGLVVQVEACGVCRTDLHLAEGDLPPRFPAAGSPASPCWLSDQPRKRMQPGNAGSPQVASRSTPPRIAPKAVADRAPGTMPVNLRAG